MPEPLFTVAIAAYNYGRYLGEAVRSALIQTWTDFEIVVADDCSTDDTFSVAQHFAKLDSRVRCWRNDHNLGSRGNINKCYQAARGRFVIPLQADDAFLRPDHLARMAAVIKAHPSVGFLYSAGLFVTNEGTVARRYTPLFNNLVGPGRFHLAVLSRLPPWPSFAAIDRTLLERLGGEDESLVVADFELTMRVACHTDVAYLAVPAAISRVHDQAQGIRVGCAEESAVCRNNLACLEALARQFPNDIYIQQVIGGTKSLFTGGHRKANAPFYHREHVASTLAPNLARWRTEHRRVGIYGAGEHTRRLFAWTDLKPADIVCIMDQNPALHGTSLADCRIVAPEAGFAAGLDTIVVSSVSQQEEIVYALALAVPAATEIFTLYPRQFVGEVEARGSLHSLHLPAHSPQERQGPPPPTYNVQESRR